jgi:glycosyltransferase involved in cell wall biosynthesis
MKTILHISADFPDPLVPAKTKAVENLIVAADGFRHVVYSINRVGWRRDIAMLPFADDRIALAYGAPPYGIGLTHYLAPVAEAILCDLERRHVMPDLIHAHKFSVEGLIAAELAERSQSTFVASLWGDTDIKIFEAKRNLHARYRSIAARAEFLLPPAPWTRDYFRDALSLSTDRFELLPVLTAGEAIIAPRTIEAPRLVSMFALDSWRRKGLDVLARAVASLSDEIPNLAVDVYGRGSPKSLLEARRIIRNAGVENRVRLKGPLPHADVQRTINRYAAFVMAPRRETYGMVHVEAVLAGVPILWSKGSGIDGLFDGMDVGYRCDPSSVEDLAAGMKFLVDNERRLKRSIGQLQARDAFAHLRSPALIARYHALLARAIRAAKVVTPPLRLLANSPQSEFHSS